MTRTYSPRNFKGLFRWMKKNARVVQVGGEDTLEATNFSFMVRNPLDRIVTNRVRKMNIAFAMAEWLAMRFDCGDVEYFTKYIKDYGRYSSNGVLIDGAYGPRLHEYGDQIQGVVDKLNLDRTSRQAVVSIYGPADILGGGGVNTPCTLGFQFLIRDHRLDMFVNMRSNDMIWGLTYDLFCFTMFHEYVLRKLAHGGIMLGNYYHHATSFHIYQRHWDLDQHLMDDYRWPYKMNPMPNDDRALLNLFNVYAQPQLHDAAKIAKMGMPQWHQDWAWVALLYANRKDLDYCKEIYPKISDATVRHTISAWLPDSEW